MSEIILWQLVLNCEENPCGDFKGNIFVQFMAQCLLALKLSCQNLESLII